MSPRDAKVALQLQAAQDFTRNYVWNEDYARNHS